MLKADVPVRDCDVLGTGTSTPTNQQGALC
jgi:hypothetical protein